MEKLGLLWDSSGILAAAADVWVAVQWLRASRGASCAGRRRKPTCVAREASSLLARGGL